MASTSVAAPAVELNYEAEGESDCRSGKSCKLDRLQLKAVISGNVFFPLDLVSFGS